MVNHTAKLASSPPAKPQTSAAPAAAAASATAESKPNSGSKPTALLASSVSPITAERRWAMIAEAAYYIAEQRGFGDGRDVEDWLLAEKQIDTALSA